MTVTYRGAEALTYSQTDYPRLNNGTQASSHLFRGIHRNQTWLAYRDPSALSLWPGPAKRFSDDAVVGEFLIDIPPGVTHVEVHALLARTEELTPGVGPPTVPPAFVIESATTSDSSRIRSVPPTVDNKKAPGIDDANWYVLPRLRVAAAPKSYWRQDWVKVSTVTNDTGIYLFSAYYRHIPIEGTIPFDTSA